MRWCWLIGHKWGPTSEWRPLSGYPSGWEVRNVICPRCGHMLYRQVRDSRHRLVYY